MLWLLASVNVVLLLNHFYRGSKRTITVPNLNRTLTITINEPSRTRIFIVGFNSHL